MDKELNWNIYRVAYSYEHEGWCVYTMINGGSILHYHSGPFANEGAAKEQMRALNNEQGTPTQEQR